MHSNILLLTTCYFTVLEESNWQITLKNTKLFFCTHLKVEEVRKVVDSELGFVADVPCRRSGAKVSIDYAVFLSWLWVTCIIMYAFFFMNQVVFYKPVAVQSTKFLRCKNTAMLTWKYYFIVRCQAKIFRTKLKNGTLVDHKCDRVNINPWSPLHRPSVSRPCADVLSG